ncbi:hypothetical protein [Paenibacillus sp. y28]|uniref:hypothetical protein n=1 Tax=Paenibacillus sp. y28 TaxID=3129110 RepID=UPI003018E92A
MYYQETYYLKSGALVEIHRESNDSFEEHQEKLFDLIFNPHTMQGEDVIALQLTSANNRQCLGLKRSDISAFKIELAD